MCSGCRMDPRDVEIMYQRQGAVDVDDFDKEVNYQTRMKGRNKRSYRGHKTRPGCPNNDYQAHVYVWTTEGQEENFFTDYYGFAKYEFLTCCGCGKQTKSRLSERYEKIKARKWAKRYGGEFNVQRGTPVEKYRRGPTYSYWYWESYDEDFKRARREYIDRHGYPKYLYNYGW